MEYRIKITEILEKTIPVKANSFVEAMDIVKEKYRNEEIILSANDYVFEVSLFLVWINNNSINIKELMFLFPFMETYKSFSEHILADIK